MNDLEKALSFMRIWISEDAHLGESEISSVFEREEGLRNLDAIENAIKRHECHDVWADDPFAAFRCSNCNATHVAHDKRVIHYCYCCGSRVVKGGAE